MKVPSSQKLASGGENLVNRTLMRPQISDPPPQRTPRETDLAEKLHDRGGWKDGKRFGVRYFRFRGGGGGGGGGEGGLRPGAPGTQ